MSRYRGPRRRLIRKFNNLPGLTTKRIDINDTTKIKTPGQHGKPTKKFLKTRSSYGLRLIEKQKLRFNYHLNERQLVRYVKQAKKSNQSTGKMLLGLLEMRLDNIVYRLGMARTIIAARQLVAHGHILVNQAKVTIPSYGCELKDIISIRDTLGSRKLIRMNLKTYLKTKNWQPPTHLNLNPTTLIGVVNKMASRNSVQLQINELLVIEYYSRN